MQCIRNKIHELEIILNGSLKHVNILCVTEHWLKEQEISYYTIQNFKLCSIFYRTNNKNGGSAIFVKENIFCKEKLHTAYLNEEKFFEHVVSEIHIEN